MSDILVNWSLYPNFQESEFKCHFSGECQMHPEFLGLLQHVRNIYAKPMIITSGYRSPEHPVERDKTRPGAHTLGLAADVSVSGIEALRLLQVLIHAGVTRIGINQKGAAYERYLHLDIADKFGALPAGVWTY